MIKSLLFPLVLVLCAAAPPDEVPAVVHPAEGRSLRLCRDSLTIVFDRRIHAFYGGTAGSIDEDIRSPKSVNISPDGSRFYINSLEGFRTVAYTLPDFTKAGVVTHRFDSADSFLWAPESGLFPETSPVKEPRTFSGRPVEAAFSHGGRYLWVPYYRRSHDLNAQDPSALAVIETAENKIVRLFETGALPKMIACSPDGRYMAVTHWGDNTVGVLRIDSERPEDWHYISCYTVDRKLNLNFSRRAVVNRDVNSGYCLRGTVFTPDNRYLLVSCMGGTAGIAVIDLKENRYLGRIGGCMPNMRHILIHNGILYASINNKGYVQKMPLARIYDAIGQLREVTAEPRIVSLDGWQNCKVPAGARTIVISPDGRFIFAACNFSSCIAVVDARSMTLLGSFPADSFPVGLDISPDGSWLISTSQGRSGRGGNAVDIFRLVTR